MKRIDFSDFIILGGFSSFIYGIYEKFGKAEAFIVLGIALLIFGFYVATDENIEKKIKKRP